MGLWKAQEEIVSADEILGNNIRAQQLRKHLAAEVRLKSGFNGVIVEFSIGFGNADELLAVATITTP